MSFLYIGLLIFSIIGLGIADWRYKLAIFRNARIAILLLILVVMFFLLWDMSGVSLGIFFAGDSPYMTHFFVLPDVLIEEIFFLVLLGYFTLILWTGSKKIWPNM